MSGAPALVAEPGFVVAGRYRLTRPLAQGGMGSVWVARHLKLDLDVALKLMMPALCYTSEAHARFEREAKAAARLRSPHIVQMLDYGVQADTPFLVMELLSGESLEARLERVPRMSLADARKLASEVASALSVAHAAGIIHRDLKPANIFYARAADEEIVKLIDFGIAKETTTAMVDYETRSGVVLGSPAYMSPEQVRGSALDVRTDLWSLGVVLFRALCGVTPFERPNVGEALNAICVGEIARVTSSRPELGPALDEFFERALARNPELRFSSAREMSDAFSTLAATERVGERFVVEGRAGAGGMGTVYRALDTLSGARVALKVMHASADPERFAREARTLAELDHPGIVRYIAHGGGPNEPPWVAMEWLDGEDLGRRLSRGPRPGVRESIELLRRVAEPLGAAHARGIVHRDLKPSNLWLVDGDLGEVKIIDFGLARGELDTARSETGGFVGTPYYVAPEQARGERRLDARADVFSLGCVLFECLTGQRAFAGEHVMAVLAKILLDEAPRAAEIDPGIPQSVDDLLSRMLAKDPALRPADGRALAAELDALSVEALDEIASPASAPAAAVTAPTPALTEDEQLVVSAILLGGRQAREALLPVVSGFDAHAEPLADGSSIVLFPRGGAASDQAARAAACALALRGLAPDVPMALATGRARIGARVPIGDAIDRAARLLNRSSTHPSAIWIDEVTSALLDERFERVADDSGIALVGRREIDATRALLGKPTPCLGREAELAMIEALFEQCAAESVARAALVTGPAGIGKSRLCRELWTRLGARAGSRDEPEIWLAQGDPVSGGAAFGLAAQMVRRAAGISEGESLERRRDKLGARVSRFVPEADRKRVTVFLAQMIGAPFDSEDDVPLASARGERLVMADQIRRAWVDFLAAECDARPLVLVFEDLHSGDRPTITLVDDALRLLADRPLMVLATARPELAQRFPDSWKDRDVHHFSLAPLPRRAAAELVRTVLGRDTQEEIVVSLVEQAAGNAFFLEELIRFEAEGSRTEGRALPESVVATVAARLEALEPTARRILRAASIFGQVFWEDAVRELLGADAVAAEVSARLDELTGAELVRRRARSRFGGQRELGFRHAFVREAAYAMLTDEDRRLGHALAAGWLERAGEVDQSVLAQHLEHGGALERASFAYAGAAEHALEGNDFDEAFSRAERGIRCGATGTTLGRLLRCRADAHFWRGESDGALESAERSLSELRPEDGAWSDAAGIAAASAMRLGRIDRLEAVGSALKRALERGGMKAGVVRAALRAAQPALMAGLHALSASLTELAEAAAGADPDPVTLSRILRSRAHHALHQGDAGRFLELMTLASRATEQAGDVRTACVIGVNTGFAELEVGAYADAERSLTTAIEQARRLGLADAVANAEHNLGWALARLGRFEEARRVEARVVEVFALLGNPRMEGASRAYLAMILAETGELTEAERQARTAVAELDAAPPLRAFALATLGEVLLLSARAHEALEAAEEAMKILERLGGIEQGEGRVRLIHVLALEAAGEQDAARASLQAACERLRARAAAISDVRLRRSFLENVPEHARTLALETRRG